MRKYLLAGTSAFALALTAGAAFAADAAPSKFDIKIGGDAYFEGGVVSQTNNWTSNPNTGGTHQTAGDFINRFRLWINPEATADNGLKYGAMVRIRANGAAGTVDGDKAYIYTTGAFGTLQAGVVYGPSDVTYVGHPMDWQMLASYDQWKYYVPTTVTAAGGAGAGAALPGHVNGAGGAGNWAWGQYSSGASTTPAAPASEGMQLLHSHDIDTKLVYYTPRFFGKTAATGLQGAVSYAPRVGSAYDGGVSVNTSVARNSAGGTPDIDSLGVAQQKLAFRDVFEVTANYTEKFDAWTVKGSIGYEGGTALTASAASETVAGVRVRYNDLNSFQVGAQVGYAFDSVQSVALGGGFVDNFRSGYRKQIAGAATDQKTDQTSWNVGGQYTYGPAVIGVKYLAQRDAGDLATAGDRTLNSVTAGGMYTVAPGLRTGLEYTYFSAKSDLSLNQNDPTAAGSKKQTGSIVMLRGVVSF